MLYAIISEDVPNSLSLRQSARPAHVERLNTLNSQNRLTLAGPHPLGEHSPEPTEFCGSLIVAEFDSIEDAQQWANQDPYVTAGVYAKVTVKPFIKALP